MDEKSFKSALIWAYWQGEQSLWGPYRSNSWLWRLDENPAIKVKIKINKNEAKCFSRWFFNFEILAKFIWIYSFVDNNQAALKINILNFTNYFQLSILQWDKINLAIFHYTLHKPQKTPTNEWYLNNPYRESFVQFQR